VRVKALHRDSAETTSNGFVSKRTDVTNRATTVSIWSHRWCRNVEMVG
jgi:hypothetical protein